MSVKPKITVMLFFSETNRASLRTKRAISRSMSTGHVISAIELKCIDFDRERNLCEKYDVAGIPLILVFATGQLVHRHYGECSSDEFIHILQNFDPEQGSLSQT